MGAGASAQDFMIQQRIAGANMSVDITMPAGGGALVQGDTVSGQGLYYVPVHSANINEAIASNSSGTPRIDQVILEVLDNVHDASGNNLARVRVLTGTATGGATLDNRTGAATLPGSALLLADILVANGAGSITTAAIRDRRKWAKGARITEVVAGAVTAASGTSTIITTHRLEVTGPVDFYVDGVLTNATVSTNVILRALVDGGLQGSRLVNIRTASDPYPVAFTAVLALSAGSHVFSSDVTASAGGTGQASTTSFIVRESLSPRVDNG